MADPLVLILLVAAGESADPVTLGIAAAARNALGWDGRVLVRSSTGPPNDSQAIDVEANEHADAVVELRWAQRHHREASLRMHVASTNAWIDRRIVFRRADADAERERTVAFAMVSALPESAGSGGAAASDADGGSVAGGKSSKEPADSAGSDAAVHSTEPDAGAPNTADAAPLSPQSPEARPQDRVELASATAQASPATMGLEVLVVDAAGDAAGAQEIGGAGAFGWFVWRNVSVRVGGSVRDTELDEASGDLLKLTASAGVGFHPWRATLSRPFGASVRVDYLLLYERLSQVTPPGQNASSFANVLSGCDAMIDGSWLFAPSVEIVGGAGVEAFAPTTIKEGRATLASLPIARAVFEGGLRLRF